MNRTIVTATAAACLLVLLQACTTAEPVKEEKQFTQVEDVPEITLNLPEENCSCVAEEKPDYTFLERGFSSLVAGDHIEAVQSFQRYQRLEESPEANWESAIAIAYISSLSKSPFYDPGEARKAYRKLSKELTKDMVVHERALFMRDALETFVVMRRHISDLKASNTTLREDLKKREEALKRLRELALGQQATQP